MTAGERERRELQEALVGTIGPEPTDSLLSYLPPVGWADVATKQDLESLERRLDGKIDRLSGKIDGRFGEVDGRFGEIDGRFGEIDGRFGILEAKMEHGLRVLVFWMATLQLATLGVLLGFWSVSGR